MFFKYPNNACFIVTPSSRTTFYQSDKSINTGYNGCKLPSKERTRFHPPPRSIQFIVQDCSVNAYIAQQLCSQLLHVFAEFFKPVGEAFSYHLQRIFTVAVKDANERIFNLCASLFSLISELFHRVELYQRSEV
jgi:hypothetical protein